MTEEIKEILQLIGSCCYYGKISNAECEKYCKYITNLQQKLEQYEKTQTYGDYVEIVNKVVELQQEKEELNRVCELYSKSLYNAELTDYKSRCEKANEKLNKLDFDNFVYGKTALKDIKRNLQNILQGSDKE